MNTLVIRLSSMGDVLLATTFLENLPPGVKVDWVVAKEFAFLIENHPRIRNLILFDKKTGMTGWFDLLRKTTAAHYDLRVDLHVNLRSMLARIYFFFLDLNNGAFTPWRSVSKEYLRHFAFIFLKRLVPKRYRPTSYWRRFAMVGSQIRQNRSADQNLNRPFFAIPKVQSTGAASLGLAPKQYFCVMAASRWASKEWGASRFAEAIAEIKKTSSLLPILIGKDDERATHDVAALLTTKKIPFLRFHPEKFTETAELLYQSAFYLGNDTGLAHLAEAVGVPAVVIFGPTRPGLGFGPWRKESTAAFSQVWCSPCSKDGKFCYRFFDRYGCFRKLSPETVVSQMKVQMKELMGGE